MNENEKITTAEATAEPMGDENTITASEETQDNILVDEILNNPAITEYIEKQVQEGIKKALRGKTPKANTTDATEQETKNFDRMTYKERLNLYKSNPQTYYKLTKGVK
jgi:hypothetical protein